MVAFNDRTGEVNINRLGHKMIITSYRKYEDIDVYFPKYNWKAQNRNYVEFKNGSIKCPYEPTVYNVGYTGEGKYKTWIEGKHTEQYKVWIQMIRRCYDIKTNKRRPTYKNCIVSKEWHNFQNFAKWYDENYYEIAGQKMHLDKDILIKNNKVYNSKSCMFVPERINTLFIKSNSTRGKLPIGVCEEHGKYRATCRNGTKIRKTLGLYNTPEEAFETYKIYKEKVINEVAEEYKNQIPDKLYQALLNYEVEITD